MDMYTFAHKKIVQRHLKIGGNTILYMREFGFKMGSQT